MRRSRTNQLFDNRVSDCGQHVRGRMRLITIGNDPSNRNTQAALTFAQTVCVGKYGVTHPH